MEETLKAISTVGFPIAIATYTIVVLNNTVKQMNETLIKLTEKIESIEGDK